VMLQIQGVERHIFGIIWYRCLFYNTCWPLPEPNVCHHQQFSLVWV
jgi:hypothetical protein